MKRKILVPMFASVMALSMNSVVNADEIENNKIDNNEENSSSTIDLPDFEEVTYKVAKIKDGVATKIRKDGSVQQVAYTGDEFKVVGIQGEWVQVQLEEGQGWIASRFVDITEAYGYTTENKINLRKEANTDSEIIKELEVGESVKVLEVSNNWLKVKKGEDEGYIRSLYVSTEAPVVEEEVEEVVQQTSNNNSNTSSDRTNISTNTSSNSNKKPVSNSNTQNKKPAQNNNSYNPPAANTSLAQAVVNLAYSKVGSPYVWGAEGPNSFDCSGLTSYVYKNAAGVSLPRSSSAQAGYGKTVSKANLQPGDLVFFATNGTGRVSHVGIYVGGGNMIHSPKPGQTVHSVSIHSSYYANKFVTAKRVF